MEQGAKKLAGCLPLIILLVSCGATGVPIPPSLELPKPVTDLRAARKGDKVTLAWTIPAKTTEGLSVRHMGPTRLCRSLRALADCKPPLAEIPPSQLPSTPAERTNQSTPVTATYTDILPRDFETQNPIAEVTYGIEMLNTSGRSAGLSNLVRVPAGPTLPPPANFKAQVTAQGVLLSWSCVTDSGVPPAADLHYQVRVSRKAKEAKNETVVGEADALDCSKLTLLDPNIEWETDYAYHAAVITIVSGPGKPEFEILGDDTPDVNVFTHDVFPPAVPTGLQAVFSGVGQAPFVDLVWTPDSESDLAGYNIYRHQEGETPTRINSELVKTPAYRDTNVVSGKKYFYSVSAVDVRGNESARSEEASEQVP